MRILKPRKNNKKLIGRMKKRTKRKAAKKGIIRQYEEAENTNFNLNDVKL